MEIIKDTSKSSVSRRALITIGVAVAALAIFLVGEVVGYKKASFSYRWSDAYERNFIGPRGKMSRMSRGGGMRLLVPHGAFGRIISVVASEIVVAGPDEAEKIVRVGADADVRKFDRRIAPEELATGDVIAAIGASGTDGVLEARLVRVFPDKKNIMNQKLWRRR